MKKFILIIFSLFYLQSLSAQSHGIALNIGYTYINTHAGYIGGEYTYLYDWNECKGFSLGAGGYYGSFNGTSKFIPEAHITYSHFLAMAEISATPYNINPGIGFTFINAIRFKTGYSWKLGHENVSMTGITFGLTFLIGTKGSYAKFF